LLEALNDYEGAVILITHDRSLIDLVADRLWLAADGHIKPFRGDMDDYARFVLDRAKAGARAPSQNLGLSIAPAGRRQKRSAGADRVSRLARCSSPSPLRV
jgi:ATP-binding cassette subfamily F protein 3